MVLMDSFGIPYSEGGIRAGAQLARESFGPGPLLVSRSGEAVALSARFDELDYVFSARPDRDNNICIGNMNLSQVILSMQHNGMAQWARPNRVEKSLFCNFVSAHPGGRDNPRKSFCEALMQYKHVDCPGKLLNNMPFPQPRYHKDGYLQKLHFIKDYKFTIAFENQSLPGYITEKISHPLAVGSIPIYWGCEAAADYYNPKAFINCHDYPDFDAVIERVQAVDNDPALYQAYLNAPPTLPGQHYHKATMTAKLRRLADEVYAEAGRRRDKL